MNESHRHHRPIRGEQQLELVPGAVAEGRHEDNDNINDWNDQNDWVVDSGSRRVGLAAIHEARHLIDEAAQHEAEARARRSSELFLTTPIG